MDKFRYLVPVILIAAVIFMAGLGTMDLSDPDESFYAETAREMLEDGEWLTPHIFDEPQFEKPPLYYWLIIGSYKVFGVNEFAARFPSALFGLIGVIGVFYLGSLLYGDRAGFFSSIIMATSIQYIALARGCVTDMVLTVFILFCLAFFINGWETGKKLHFYLAALMAALAVLTKGPIGLFLPGMAVILYLTFTLQWKKVLNIPILGCLLVLAAVSLPWYVIVTQVHGDNFIGEFFGSHNVTRFLEPEHRIGSSPFFYFPIVLGGFLPWTVFLPQALVDMYRAKGQGVRGKSFRSAGLFLFLWVLVVFGFFSISRTKLVTYIFPLFPVLAVVAGRMWYRLTFDDVFTRFRKGMKFSYIILLLAGVGGAIAGPLIFKYEFPGVNSIVWLIVAEVLFLFGIAGSFVSFEKGSVHRAVVALVLGVMLASIPIAYFVLPSVNDYVVNRKLSEMFVDMAGPDATIAAEDDHRRGVAFYTGRRDIKDVHPYHDLKMYLLEPGRVWGIIQVKHFDQLTSDPDFKGDVYLVSRAGNYVLITNQAPEGLRNNE